MVPRFDIQYTDLVKRVLLEGYTKPNRTGMPTKGVQGALISHNMAEGFPLLSLRKIGLKTSLTELEGFLKGITDKEWFKERNCHIWDEWKNPKSDDDNDLGPLGYSFGLRNFGGMFIGPKRTTPTFSGFDQLRKVVDDLKAFKFNRRLLVSHWDLSNLPLMALAPCHTHWQLIAQDEQTLGLVFSMRSSDVFLGLPYNFTYYGALLILIAQTVGMVPGILTYTGSDVHIYENALEASEMLLERVKTLNVKSPPKVVINCNDVFNFEASMAELTDYAPMEPQIKVEVAV